MVPTGCTACTVNGCKLCTGAVDACDSAGCLDAWFYVDSTTCYECPTDCSTCATNDGACSAG